ncbi:MAG TPA: hypothetical protein VGJ48_02785 [Pyrinomonadaceae bacterium]
MHDEKRRLARSIMHTYGGKLQKDIAVKLVKRKTYDQSRGFTLNEGAY